MGLALHPFDNKTEREDMPGVRLSAHLNID